MRRLAIVVGLVACQVNEQRQAASPLADCEHVAQTLASFELGNYATPEQRTPVIAKQRDACKAAHVTRAEVTCLDKAHDTWAARACVPSLFPATGGKADCKQAIGRMREAFLSALGSGAGSQVAQLDTMLPVIQLSCEQDQWPASVTQCMTGTKPGDMPAFQQCAAQLPQPMQEKMKTRMLAREQQK